MNIFKFILLTSFIAVLSACGDNSDNSTASATAESTTSEAANSTMSTMDAEAKAKAEEARALAKKLAEERDVLENE